LRFQGEEAEIYDEVTEDQYKSVVQGRLAKDDFVVDYGVGGYLDNGMDDWESVGAQEDSEDERMHKTSTPLSLTLHPLNSRLPDAQS
jgi:DNA polymerase alpha subunit A